MLTEATASANELEIPPELFDSLDQTLKTSGRAALVDQLVRDLDGRKAYRPLLDALLLKARLDLGLSAIPSGTSADWPEATRLAYEERYIDAIRTVGDKFLTSGDIASAWPYFRAIGESKAIVDAIDGYLPDDTDERLHAIVDVAFNQGANPRRGFELILKHYGTCSAVTAFESLPRDDKTRSSCADALVKQLHEHLTNNIRAEIETRGQPLPPSGTPIPALLNGRDWLFADEAYHIDVSHLAATVRVGPLLQDLAIVGLALELAEYGMHLSPRHVYEGDVPFEKVYDDHAVYFRTLLGQDVDIGITHFASKLSDETAVADPDRELPTDDIIASQVVVGLLARIGRDEEALDYATRYLSGVPDSALFCPGIAQLADRADRAEKLASMARRNGDLVQYAMAILRGAGESD